MTLEQITRRQVIHVSPSTSIDTAMALMDEYEIRHVPVVEDDRLLGIVSHRDLMATVGGLWSAPGCAPPAVRGTWGRCAPSRSCPARCTRSARRIGSKTLAA
jgi:CBS-domain-containing membrane protein